MFGTISRMQARPGMEDALMALSKEYDGLDIPGHVAHYVYKMDNEPNTYYMAVIFDSRDAYMANANNPAQNDRFMRMRELLAADPEWHDGDIVSAG